ncbi:hypothetical protein AB0L64_06150 [Kribbella sp. NPDC051936]|uniref:hypothetical protein n=1 Tax=Kribbella sp. NPDC051936 TaxID=3154946 RepID=UPI0034278929
MTEQKNRADGRSGSDNPEAGRGARVWGVVKRAGVSVVGLVAAWAVGFFGPGLWESAKVAAGQDALGVVILRDYQIPTDAEFHFDQVIVPERLSRFPWPDGQAAADGAPTVKPAWTYRADEVDAMTTAIRLVFTGTRSDTVVIQKFALRVTERRPPVRGILTLDAQGGEATPMEPRYLRANLDTGNLAWRTGEDKPTSPAPLALDRGDQLIVDVIAATTKCDCDWVVDVTYTSGSETATMTMPPRGHFRTSSLSRAAVWNPFEERPTCEDFRDLDPTLCDRLPPQFGGGRPKVRLRPRSGKYATGYGLYGE